MLWVVLSSELLGLKIYLCHNFRKCPGLSSLIWYVLVSNFSTSIENLEMICLSICFLHTHHPSLPFCQWWISFLNISSRSSIFYPFNQSCQFISSSGSVGCSLRYSFNYDKTWKSHGAKSRLYGEQGKEVRSKFSIASGLAWHTMPCLPYCNKVSFLSLWTPLTVSKLCVLQCSTLSW